MEGFEIIRTKKQSDASAAVIVRVEERYSRNKDIKGVLHYIVTDKCTDKKIALWNTRGLLKDVDLASRQIIALQKFLGKAKGRRLHHLIISFKEDVKDIELIRCIAEKLADVLGEEYQLLWGIHTDTDNLHIHIAMSAVSYKTGLKWHKTNQEFQEWREKLLKIIEAELNAEKLTENNAETGELGLFLGCFFNVKN